MSEKLLFVDVETGGFEPKDNPLLEVGMCCESHEGDQNSIDFSVIIQQSEEDWQRCTEGALNVNQFTFDECMLNGVPIYTASDMLCSWLLEHDINSDTVTWVGQNPDFDLKFLSYYMGAHLEFAGLTGMKVINIMSLAKRLKIKDESFRPVSLSGGNISLALGIQSEDSMHRAIGGVRAVQRNYYELMKRLG